jgi:hypothetical protein
MTYTGKTLGGLTAVKAVLDGIAGVQATYVGIPEAPGARLTVSVSVGDRTLRDKMTGYQEADQAYFLEFAYRVAGNEGTAETQLADWLDLLTEAWLTDRTVGGVFRNSVLDFTLAATPTYRPTAGAEYRVLPVVWLATFPR